MTARKDIRSIAELLADVADRKRRAAELRCSVAPPGQSPSEIFQAACASIGMYLEECYGFKYSKSALHARRRTGEFTFEIRFQSDRNNIAGERVGLWIHGTVYSSRLKKWREAKFSWRLSDIVAGGQIGNLQEDHCWSDWDLADAVRRDEVIRDAINTIEVLALPYFARFEDLPSLFTLLVNEDLPSMSIYSTVHFLMCFADWGTARLAARNYLKRRPDLVDAYQKVFQVYEEAGLDGSSPSNLVEHLAYSSHAFGFGDLASG